MAEAKPQLAPDEAEFLSFVVKSICDAYSGAWSAGAHITTVRSRQPRIRPPAGPSRV